MSLHWVHDLMRVQRSTEACVLVTVASIRGSAPRAAGTRMVVTPENVMGTIGGGNLEFKSISIARDMLGCAGASMLKRFPLSASLGQCCGGLVNLLFEPVAATTAWPGALAYAIGGGESCVMVTSLHGNDQPGKLLLSRGVPDSNSCDAACLALQQAAVNRQTGKLVEVVNVNGREYLVETVGPAAFHLYLFGAGHVGRALVKILGDLDCQVTWVDSRQHEFPALLPANTTCSVVDEPEDVVLSAEPGAYFLVMTHSHRLDQTISETILRRGDHAWFGLIGSASKRRLFEKRLIQRGVQADSLATMNCPIGLQQITSKEPMAIALGVAAQLLQHSEFQARCVAGPIAPVSQNPALARVSGQNHATTRASA